MRPQVWSEHTVDPELLLRSEVVSPISDQRSFLSVSKTPRLHPERQREILGALLKAEDSAHSPQVKQVLRGPPNSMSTDRLFSGVLW